MANAVIGALRVNLGLDSAQFQDGLKKAQSGMAKFGQTMKQGAMVASAAFVAAGTGIAYAVKGILNNADDMAKAAQKIGVPVDELSRLRHAADLSGVSFEGLQGSMRRLSANMDEAFTKGTGAAADAFTRLGISLTNADGSMRSSSEVLTDLSARFAEMPDGAEKTALAMDLMGRAGADMIPLLNGGADALAAMKAEADQLGIVITPEMAKNAERFNDNLTRLSAVVAGLATMIASELAEPLANFTDWLVEMAVSFRQMDPWLQSAITRFGVFAAVLGPIGAVLAVVVAGIVAIGAPVALAAAGIVALTAAVVAFWPEIQKLATTVGEFVAGAWAQFVAAWDGITVKIEEVKAAVAAFAQSILDTFRALPGQMLQIGADIINGLWQGIQSKWEDVKGGISGMATGVVDRFKSALSIFSPSRVMHGIGVNIMEGLGNGMESMSSNVLGFADTLANGLTQTFMSVIDGTKSVGQAIKDLTKQIVSMMLNRLVQSFVGMLFGGGGFLGGIFGGFRAKGGPVSAGRAYVVGERGPELMVPNTSGTVIPNSALGDGPREIIVTLVGEEGRMFTPRVQQISGQVAGVVVRQAEPGMVKNSVSAVRQTMRNNPGFSR